MKLQRINKMIEGFLTIEFPGIKWSVKADDDRNIKIALIGSESPLYAKEIYGMQDKIEYMLNFYKYSCSNEINFMLDITPNKQK